MIRIKRVEGLGSPAAIRHDGICREVMVDADTWKDIPSDERRSIILHEWAHCAYDVYSEEEADEIALRYLIAEGGDPQDAIDAIANNLPNNPGVPGRIARLRALMTEPMCEECAKISYYGDAPIPALDFGLFETQLDDAALIDEGFDNVQDPASPAPQQKGKFWNALAAIATTTGQIFGQRPNINPQSHSGTPRPSSGGNATGWLIGGGVVLLLVVLYFVAKKK